MTVRRRRIDVGGVALAVTDSGPPRAAVPGLPSAQSGRAQLPVVVLHGFTGSAASMSGVAAALAGRWRTLCVDLVGHGASDAPDDVAAYAMDAVVGQLAALLDALAIPRAHWLGYSMGGRTALCFAAAHPGRVASLLLVGASAGLAQADERAARVAADEALARSIERDGVEAFVERWLALPLFASQARLGPAALAAARAQRLDNRAHGLANSLRGMGTGAQAPQHARLARIDAPVCLVVGAGDEKFDGIARDLARRLPDARIERIDGAGHAAHLEAPVAFARVANAFVRECEAP